MRVPTTGEVFDEATGEARPYSGEVELKQPRFKHQNRVHRRWGLIDFTQIRRLKLTALGWEMLFFLAEHIDREAETIHMRPNDIAKGMGLNYPSAHRMYSLLVKQGVVQKIDDGELRINPMLMYRGSAFDWEVRTEQYGEEIKHDET